MIARSSSSLPCKNFNIAYYSKNIKGIIIKIKVLAHQDKVQLQGKGHNSESYSYAPDRQVLVPHVVLLLYLMIASFKICNTNGCYCSWIYRHQSAKKDNDFVYHDKVPAADSLPEVKGKLFINIHLHPC